MFGYWDPNQSIYSVWVVGSWRAGLSSLTPVAKHAITASIPQLKKNGAA
jgi:hypothetical protein